MKLGARLKNVSIDGIVDIDAFGGGDVSITEHSLLRQYIGDDSLIAIKKQNL